LLQEIILAGDAVGTTLSDHTDLPWGQEAGAVHALALLPAGALMGDLALGLSGQVFFFDIG
jgi:hypothetical protein